LKKHEEIDPMEVARMSQPDPSTAWRVESFGAPADALTLCEAPVEPVGADDIRVDVQANGLNAFDVGMCLGTHPMRPSPPFVLGGELVGVVSEVGSAVWRFAAGDRVVAMSPLAHGCFRRTAVVPEYAAHAVPDDVPLPHAAALLVNYQAAFVALVRRARVAAGEWVLVHAAAGAFGSALVQVALVNGARVIATAGTEEKRQVCLGRGADVALDSRSPALAEQVREITEGHGADVVCDLVGGALFEASIEAAAFEARVLSIGWVSGTMPRLDPMTIVTRNLLVGGMSWGAVYPRQAPEIVRDVHAQILRLYATGDIEPLVGQVRPHTELPDALQAMHDASTIGKSVLTWSGSSADSQQRDDAGRTRS
jgi:NADPH:quinone reductase